MWQLALATGLPPDQLASASDRDLATVLALLADREEASRG